VASDTLLTPFRPPVPAGTNGAARLADDDPPPAVVTTITPELAREWLQANTRNRPLRDDDVNAYARDMMAGTFKLNGATILRAANGDIIDGQHRLTACDRAGAPFRSYVITGLPFDVQDTVDAGIVRKDSDQLALRGEYQPKSLAAITKWAIRWAAGQRGRSVGGVIKPTHSEVLGFIDANPEVRDATHWAINAHGRYRPVRISVYGMAWLLFTRMDGGLSRGQAEEFLNKTVTGADVGIGHPAYTLRERFRRADDLDERLNSHEQLALFVTAWNGLRDGKEVRRVALPYGGLTTRNFPEPH
jgi:hypothetical protein